MFRSSDRSLLQKLLENGVHCSSKSIGTHSEEAGGFNVVSRYLSHQPLSSTGGSYAKHFPPLFRPLPGLKLPPCLRDSMERSPTKITTLPNGPRIASKDTLGPAACVGIYVNCGSTYESKESIGVSHLLERPSFKSTKNRSHLKIVHDVEKTGGNVSASASREQMGYSYYTIRTVELLVERVRNPQFLDSEVEEQLTLVEREIGEITNDPQMFLLETLHVSGYSGPLVNPLMAPEAVLEKIDESVLGKFSYENYRANRMVLAAYGVDHEQFFIYCPLCGSAKLDLTLVVISGTK